MTIMFKIWIASHTNEIRTNALKLKVDNNWLQSKHCMYGFKCGYSIILNSTQTSIMLIPEMIIKGADCY